MSKLLTIGIPTYNRINSLKNIVDFFKKENVFNNSQVEFIISDNGSNDGTDDFLKSLHERHKDLIILINENNEGAEANFSRIIQLATSKYVWLVGDDDCLQKGIVNRLLEVLESYKELSWVFLRHDFLKNGEKIKNQLVCSSYYENGIELFNLVCQSSYGLGGMMFVTASVHRTDYAKEFVNYYNKTEESIKNKNMALTLGLAFNSCILGPAFITEIDEITDDVSNISWKDSIVKVFCRDQIAILDLVAKKNKIDLLAETEFEKGLLKKRPEWAYLKSKCKSNNYAFWFYLKHKPIKIIIDFFEIFLDKLKRGVKE